MRNWCNHLSSFEGLSITVIEYSWFPIRIQLCQGLYLFPCIDIRTYEGKNSVTLARRDLYVVASILPYSLACCEAFNVLFVLVFSEVPTSSFGHWLNYKIDSAVPLTPKFPQGVCSKNSVFFTFLCNILFGESKRMGRLERTRYGCKNNFRVSLKMYGVWMWTPFTLFRSNLESDCCGQVMKTEYLFTGWLTFEFPRVLVYGIRHTYYV
jgi:hypothetical protein